MSTPAPSGFAAVLSKLNAALGGSPNDPSNTALMGFAAGLGQASAPHMLTPVSGGQALSMGAQAAQAYQQRALANQLQQTALIPYQQARAKIAGNVASGEMYQLTPAEQAAVASGKFTPQILSKLSALETQLKVLNVNTDSIPIFREAETWAKNNVTPYGQPSNTRTVSAAGAATGGAPPAQGPLPTGTTEGKGGALTLLPGVLPALEAGSGATAAGTYPYLSALKRTGLEQGPVTNRILSLAPAMPPLFNPGLPGGSPQPAAPTPAALAAAQAAARQRQMGTMQGVQGAGGQLPGGPPGVPPAAPGAPAISPAASAAIQALRQRAAQNATGAPPATPAPTPPAAPQGAPVAPQLPVGTTVIAPGMTPSQVTGQTVNQQRATTALNADIAATKERQQRVANLEELNAVASGLKTGPGTDAHIAVLKALESVPGAVGLSAGKLQTITNAQIFNKTALNLSLQTVSGAGQHAYDAFKSVMNAFPELSKTPLANAVVTGSLLATARYEADKSKFAANWQQANGMGYVQGKGSYDAAWAKNASFMSYFLNALPPAARAELFQKARTNATLRMEINQAAKSDAWLRANGY